MGEGTHVHGDHASQAAGASVLHVAPNLQVATRPSDKRGPHQLFCRDQLYKVRAVGLVVIAKIALGGEALAARIHQNHAVSGLEVLQLLAEDLAREGEPGHEDQGRGGGVARRPVVKLHAGVNGKELALCIGGV